VEASQEYSSLMFTSLSSVDRADAATPVGRNHWRRLLMLHRMKNKRKARGMDVILSCSIYGGAEWRMSASNFTACDVMKLMDEFDDKTRYRDNI
jgi:hypothetical protein